jgi:transposase-like protein
MNGNQKQRFSDVIERANAECGLTTLAARWGTNEQNLRRWRDNPQQSPKFDDLMAMAGRMSIAERMDLAKVLFGEDFLTEMREAMQAEARRILDSLNQARDLAGKLAGVGA